MQLTHTDRHFANLIMEFVNESFLLDAHRLPLDEGRTTKRMLQDRQLIAIAIGRRLNEGQGIGMRHIVIGKDNRRVTIN